MLDFGKKYKIQDFRYQVIVLGNTTMLHHNTIWKYNGQIYRESCIGSEEDFTYHLTRIMKFYNIPLRFETYLTQAELCQ